MDRGTEGNQNRVWEKGDKGKQRKTQYARNKDIYITNAHAIRRTDIFSDRRQKIHNRKKFIRKFATQKWHVSKKQWQLQWMLLNDAAFFVEWIAQNHVGRFTNRKGIRPWVKHGTGHGDWLMVPAVWPFRALTCQSAAMWLQLLGNAPLHTKGGRKKTF